MLSQVSEDIQFLKYFTPLTLFDPQNIAILDNQAIGKIIVLLILAIVFIISGTIIFKKRDLSL